MDQFAAFYLAHTFWFWLSLAAILLALEAALGTEWLLWLAASAALVALLALTPLPLGVGGQIGVFAAATLVLTVGARKFMGRPADASDVNDAAGRLVGETGTVSADFVQGQGRVRAGGVEWPAEADTDLPAGARVVVEAVAGTRLRVRAT